MSAIYWVEFEGHRGVISVNAADARSFKRKDIRVSYRNAVKRARAKLPKGTKRARLINCRCVG